MGFRCVGYVEQNEYCKQVLRQRIRDGFLDDAPIFDDVRTFNGLHYRGRVDLLSAGFPCQPFSTAARGRNVQASLWDYVCRIADDVTPRFIFAENVAGSLKQMLRAENDLRARGYTVRGPAPVSAADVGAPHPRERLWILGYANGNGESGRREYVKVAGMRKASSPIWTEARAEDLRMADGMAHRMVRFRAVGNGQVPAVVVRAWEELTA